MKPIQFVVISFVLFSVACNNSTENTNEKKEPETNDMKCRYFRKALWHI